MPIDQELLQILVCPEDRTPLTEAGADLIQAINTAIDKGVIKNRAGKLVDERIDGGLIRQDGQYLYPVREEIPIMLIDEAIPMSQVPSAASAG